MTTPSSESASNSKNSLEAAILSAFNEPTDIHKANAVYRAFLTKDLYLPIEKTLDADDVAPLFLIENDCAFLPVFSNELYLNSWAGEESSQMEILELSGAELLKGVNDKVYLCLDINQEHYKEFSPEEIDRMRLITAKVETLMKKNVRQSVSQD